MKAKTPIWRNFIILFRNLSIKMKRIFLKYVLVSKPHERVENALFEPCALMQLSAHQSSITYCNRLMIVFQRNEEVIFLLIYKDPNHRLILKHDKPSFKYHIKGQSFK